MRQKRLLIIIGILGLFLCGVIYFFLDFGLAANIEVTQSEEASVSTPEKPKEKSKKTTEIELILSKPFPLFRTAT